MERIPVEDLVEGTVYRLHSRNLRAGVYRAKTGGYIGIRHKFGDRYLFEEYDYAGGPPYGTATPLEVLGVVPEGIELREYVDPYCPECGRGTVFLPDDPEKGRTPGWNYHADDFSRIEDPHNSVVSTYAPLFEELEKYDER